ncbi:hypothetical protein M9Y10_034282 [Tritrichomonas musculus]|uniref:Myb-like DNA-binding domain containing protein n=1 Tax=Tritrichomonas musculus TaxID=1915356 RepID=A0ABR2KGG5_9EUKA
MTTEEFDPLLSVAEQYIIKDASQLQTETLDHLKLVMRMFINGKITYENASKEFTKNIYTTKPLDKINDILNVSSTPISINDPVLSDENVLCEEMVKNSNNSCVIGNQIIIFQSRKRAQAWSEYEDQRLLHAINKYGLKSWSLVSSFVGNGRSQGQCSQRWYRGLNPKISKLLWTTDEEEKLLKLVEKYGDKSWTTISFELGNRSDAQCRYRYNLLKESIKDKQKLCNSNQNQKCPKTLNNNNYQALNNFNMNNITNLNNPNTFNHMSISHINNQKPKCFANFNNFQNSFVLNNSSNLIYKLSNTINNQSSSEKLFCSNCNQASYDNKKSIPVTVISHPDCIGNEIFTQTVHLQLNKNSNEKKEKNSIACLNYKKNSIEKESTDQISNHSKRQLIPSISTILSQI